MYKKYHRNPAFAKATGNVKKKQDASSTAQSVTASATAYCSKCKAKFESLSACLTHELTAHAGCQKTAPSRRKKGNIIPVQLQYTAEDVALNRQIIELCENTADRDAFDVFAAFFRLSEIEINRIATKICCDLRFDLPKNGAFKIKPFGSFFNGLALKDSDMDIFVCENNGQNSTMECRENYEQLFRIISIHIRRSHSFRNVVAIPRARVPIIKCEHRSTRCSVDINTTAYESTYNTCFFKMLLQLDKRIEQLLLYVKIWGQQLGIIGRVPSISSYCLCTLVLFFLQSDLPHRQSILPSIQYLQCNLPPNYINGVNYNFNLRNRDCLHISNDVTVYNLINEFFDFYASFEFGNKIISPYLACTVDVEQFSSGNCLFTEYDEMRQRMVECGRMADYVNINLSKPMIVQDAFCLTRNIATSITEANVAYFTHCAQESSAYIANHFNDDALFTIVNLIFDIKKQMVKAKHQLRIELPLQNVLPEQKKNHAADSVLHVDAEIVHATSAAESIRDNSDSSNGMSCHWYIILGNKPWLQLLARVTADKRSEKFNLIKASLENAIEKLLQEVFSMSIETTQCDNTIKQWQITAIYDTWTQRNVCATRDIFDFFEKHVAQTQIMLKNAQTKPFEMKAALTMEVVINKHMLKFKIASVPPRILIKKEPLSKFFNQFKNIVQFFPIHQTEIVD